MKLSSRVGIAVIALIGWSVTLLATAAPRAEALELDDKERALVAKEERKAKQGGSEKSSKDKACGNVDIGNSEEKRGSGRVAERNKTVIVTGPVINTANCKR